MEYRRGRITYSTADRGDGQRCHSPPPSSLRAGINALPANNSAQAEGQADGPFRTPRAARVDSRPATARARKQERPTTVVRDGLKQTGLEPSRPLRSLDWAVRRQRS